MNLISLGFLLFAALTVLVYHMLPGRSKAPWLLLSSLFFYLCADPRCLLFLLASVAAVFFAARRMPMSRRPKALAAAALLVDLGFLAGIKLLPFSLGLAGFDADSLRILVPLGLSFYSLQAAGYLLDVYRGKTAPEESFWRFLLFMCYFPIILQGPISRYDQLAPQLRTPKPLTYRELSFGAQLTLWGFFKKLVIADRAGILVNLVYGEPGAYAGAAVWAASLLYCFQLYADFSGCVDICRGLSQMLGIELAENFRRPYFSRSIQELWRRWHITLGSWLRDYVYFPLGGRRKGRVRRNLNLVIVFLVSGLWHGVGLNYLFWGLLQAVFQIVGAATRPGRERFWKRLGAAEAPPLLQQFGTFLLFWLSVHFFRAPGLRTGFRMAAAAVRGFSPAQLWDGSLLSLGLDGPDLLVLALALVLLLAVSLWQEKLGSVCVRARIAALPLPLRWGIWLLGLAAVLVLGVYGPGYSKAQFIYMGF